MYCAVLYCLGGERNHQSFYQFISGRKEGKGQVLVPCIYIFEQLLEVSSMLNVTDKPSFHHVSTKYRQLLIIYASAPISWLHCFAHQLLPRKLQIKAAEM
jgi:hypothetical protein